MPDTKWIKVNIEGSTVGSEQTLYIEVDKGLTEKQILDEAQDAVNEAIGGWGVQEVDESEVPENEQ